jgi:hypothetical protein
MAGSRRAQLRAVSPPAALQVALHNTIKALNHNASSARQRQRLVRWRGVWSIYTGNRAVQRHSEDPTNLHSRTRIGDGGMPWKESAAMDQRLAFVRDATRNRFTMVALSGP